MRDSDAGRGRAGDPIASGDPNRTFGASGQSDPGRDPQNPDSSSIDEGAADRIDPDEPTSGLKNPAAAIRGVGIGTLVLEAVVLLLAIQPIRIVAPDTSGWALGAIAGLAAVSVAVTGLLRRPWGWHVGLALQIAMVLTGFLQYSLFVLGAIFLAIWVYLLRVKTTLAKPAEFDH